MKKIRIVQAAILIAFVSILASCGSSREYYSPPRNSASFSLILGSGPGIYASRYSDGRYYYRSPQGYTYWRGNDNRYYLDRSHLGNVHYNRRQYNDWNRHYNNHSQGRRHRH